MKAEMSASPRAGTELSNQLLLDTRIGLFWHGTKDQHSKTGRFSSRWVDNPPTDQWGASCSSGQLILHLLWFPAHLLPSAEGVSRG